MGGRMDDVTTTVGKREVRSTDGVRLAVYERGDVNRPTVLAIHGYPDNHTVWDGIADILDDRFHVVTYDVRGAGASGRPRERSAYRIAQLTDDLVAVLDSLDKPVHLLAHDWGSIQAWPALVDPRVRDRVLSFTSISGPSLGHAGAWMRRALRRPVKLGRQLAESYYIAVFQLPVLPEALARRGLIDRGVRRIAARTGEPEAADGPDRAPHDSVNGIQLYRANMLPRLTRSRPERITIPVQVLAPERDPHVSVALQTEAPRPYVDDLRVEVIDGGHWVVVQQPDLVAAKVATFIA